MQPWTRPDAKSTILTDRTVGQGQHKAMLLALWRSRIRECVDRPVRRKSEGEEGEKKQEATTQHFGGRLETGNWNLENLEIQPGPGN